MPWTFVRKVDASFLPPDLRDTIGGRHYLSASCNPVFLTTSRKVRNHAKEIQLLFDEPYVPISAKCSYTADRQKLDATKTLRQLFSLAGWVNVHRATFYGAWTNGTLPTLPNTAKTKAKYQNQMYISTAFPLLGIQSFQPRLIDSLKAKLLTLLVMQPPAVSTRLPRSLLIVTTSWCVEIASFPCYERRLFPRTVETLNPRYCSSSHSIPYCVLCEKKRSRRPTIWLGFRASSAAVWVSHLGVFRGREATLWLHLLHLPVYPWVTCRCPRTLTQVSCTFPYLPVIAFRESLT